MEGDNSKNLEECNNEKVRIGLLTSLAILFLCFLLSLGVNIYQRRLIKSKNKQFCHQIDASGNGKKNITTF